MEKKARTVTIQLVTSFSKFLRTMCYNTRLITTVKPRDKRERISQTHNTQPSPVYARPRDPVVRHYRGVKVLIVVSRRSSNCPRNRNTRRNELRTHEDAKSLNEPQSFTKLFSEFHCPVSDPLSLSLSLLLLVLSFSFS